MTTSTFKTALKHFGSELLSIFKKGTTVASEVAPIVDLALPQFATIYNATVSAAMTAEVAGQAAEASGAGNTSTAKAALVISAITPTITKELATLGISPTSTHITDYVNAVVATLNAFPAPAAATASATPATPPAAA